MWGVGAFNLFNHFNPRDVQNNLASARYGGIFQFFLARIPRQIRIGVLDMKPLFLMICLFVIPISSIVAADNASSLPTAEEIVTRMAALDY